MCFLHKEKSCYWNITWLDIYLTILFSLTIFFTCHTIFLLTYLTILLLFTTLIYPKPICLLIFIQYLNQVYDNKEKNPFSVVICVCCMSHSEKFISQDGILQCSIGSQQKKVSCHQLWTKVNASLIFQPRENIASFSMLL